MSYDLYFWPSGWADDPGCLAERLADEEAEALKPDARVLAFRAELLRRWPDLADMIAPWHRDLDWRQPWGRADLADRFVGLTLPVRWEHTGELPELANEYGLDCYDPQSDELIRPIRHPVKGSPRDAAERRTGPHTVDVAPLVTGWIFEDNVVRLLEHISRHIGYAYDDLDAAALTGALEQTDDESADAWFVYPLEGRPPLTVHLAQSLGSAVVSVRVEGSMDPLLAARIETLLELL